jgi:hypothetical protein
MLLSVLQPENSTDADPSDDFGHCGANYCPDSSPSNGSNNFSIDDDQVPTTYEQLQRFSNQEHF